MDFNILIIDNFYKNPYNVLDIALNQTYLFPEIQPRRSLHIKNIELYRCYFEKILSPYIKKIINIEGSYHYRISSEKKYIHTDDYDMAAIVYLNPNVHINSGTSFYKKKTNSDKNTEYELITTIGSVFNRLIIYNAKQYHFQTNEFGDNIHNGRITQIFFFDVLK